ncbi:MAG: hypothetical protein JWO06_303 [Bacteroidota bacterium]|nr:hypothetical protein [Bacteroidota bacterium]
MWLAATMAGFLQPSWFKIILVMTVEQLREFCLSLPHATEDVKWGNDLCFCIGGKMFCVTGFLEPLKASFKVTDEEFEELSASAGIVPAPYTARYKWIYVQDSNRFSKKQWEHYIQQSYELVKSKLPKKMLNAM